MTVDYLQDRAAVIGEKLAAKVAAKIMPSNAELAFFDTCVAELCVKSPAHALRLLAIELHAAVNKAKADRAAWLRGRAEALALAAARQQAKKAKHRALMRHIVREIRDRANMKATPTSGINRQGLPFVAQLPAEWQNAEKVA
jgi:hypothetical protein